MAAIRKPQRRPAARSPKRKEKSAVLKRRPATRHTSRAAEHAADPPRAWTERQFTVYLPNKPGQMGKLGRILKRAGINLHAMSVTEQTDMSGIRMIVSNDAKMRRAFNGAGLKFSERKMVLVRAENDPGALGDIGARLAKHKINVEYAYASSSPDALHALIVLAVDHTREAIRVLA